MGALSNAIQELESRLQGQANATSLLSGVAISSARGESSGRDDLPMVRIDGLEYSEEYAHQSVCRGLARIKITIGSRSEDGWSGFAELLERVCDAIEYNADGVYSPSLGGMSLQQAKFTVTDPTVTQVGMWGELGVELAMPRVVRGGRRL